MNKKSHIFLIFSIFSFLITAGAFLYALNAISQQGIKYAELKTLFGEQTAKEASYNSVQGLLVSTKDDREKIKNLFIKEKDTIAFISEIETNARMLGVTLTTNELSILPAVADPNGQTTAAQLLVGFDFSGSESAVWKYLTLLENIPYHKKLTQVSFVRTDENTWKANVNMQLTLQYD